MQSFEMQSFGRVVVLTAVALISTACGCNRDARLADHNLRDVSAREVSAYGKRLDKSASPTDVVYVLLRAIADDYAAGNDQKAREAALDIQFGVCAGQKIVEIYSGNRQLADQDRQEMLYRAVHRWAPTLGHYRESFTGEFEDLAPRMREEIDPAHPNQAQVYVNVFNPSDGDRDRSGVVAWIRLIRVNGFWRVYWVGFDPTSRDWTARLPKSSYRNQLPVKRTEKEG